MQLKNETNAIQYSVLSIAEIDMMSSGSGYHSTNSLTIIRKQEEKTKQKAKEHTKRTLSTMCSMISSRLPP